VHDVGREEGSHRLRAAQVLVQQVHTVLHVHSGATPRCAQPKRGELVEGGHELAEARRRELGQSYQGGLIYSQMMVAMMDVEAQRSTTRRPRKERRLSLVSTNDVDVLAVS
jgi:hypothetical protein